MNNRTLNKAKAEKNNEFYTQMADIERELFYYKEHFKDKIIYLNCDNPNSNFFKYFSLNFDFFGLKKLIATYYDTKNPTYKIELTGYGKEPIKTRLRGNGDFNNAENIEILKEADIIVTNPPFSLFRKFIALMVEYNKKFIVIGNINAVTHKEIFPLIKTGKIWIGRGFNITMTFRIPEHYKEWSYIDDNGNKYAKLGGIAWYTNLKNKKYKEPFLKMLIGNKYDPKKYPKFDDYDAIFVAKKLDIPYDYYDEMRVPITFIENYDPKEFELIGTIGAGGEYNLAKGIINGKAKYKGLIIKRRK